MDQALRFDATTKQDAQRAEILRLFHGGSHGETADMALRWVQQHPHDWEIVQVLCDSCMLSGYLDEAERLYNYGLENHGGVFYLSGLGVVSAARGEHDKAHEYLRKAISLAPADPRSWMELAAIHKFRKDDNVLLKLRRQIKRKDLDNRTRSILHYALCKACNDLGKWDQAWYHASEGARLDMPDFKPDEFRAWTTDLFNVFDAEFLAPREGRGLPTEAPIFIVGAPRSGTTLAERILAGTGRITALGEIPTIPRLSTEARRQDYERGFGKNRHSWVRRWTDEAFAKAAQYYLDDVTRRAGGTLPERFVDKLPGNIVYLGQISLMFPKARIVRMHRHPLDTCVSLYTGRFGYGHHYTRKPEWLALAWKSFQEAGDFLGPIIPNPVLDVHYEELAADPERQGRRLVEFAGFDWRPEILNPDAAGYATTTRSQHQVRAKITTGAVARWKRYRNKIGPLAEALGIDISGE